MTESTSEYKKRIEEIKQSIENEPYMAKMREDIAEGISKTGTRQATVEEQFQAVIDETTGKDVISAPEIIVARNGAQTLGERLDEDKMEVNTQFSESFYSDVPHVASGINSKIIYKVSDFKYQVIAQKANKNGYTMMDFEKGIGAISDAVNYGGNKDLLRLTAVRNLTDVVMSFTPQIKATSQLSGSNDFIPTVLEGGQYNFQSLPPLISNNATNKSNSWFTFDVEVAKKHFGFLDLSFLGTASSCESVEVYIDDELKTTLNTKTDSLKAIFFSVPVNKIGLVEVKIKTVGALPCRAHFLGVNVQKLNDYNADFSSNGFMYITDSSHYINQSRGANEYAFFEKESGRWAGSYHGGETINDLMINLDGVEISTMSNGSFKIGKNLKIIQNTNIINKVIAQSVTEISHDSTYVINVSFNVPQPFLVSSFYVGMTCSNDTFNELIFPELVTMSSANRKKVLPPTKKVIQLDKTTGNTITSSFSAVSGYVGKEPMAISFTSGSYAKVYHGLAVLSDKMLENIVFGAIKVFD